MEVKTDKRTKWYFSVWFISLVCAAAVILINLNSFTTYWSSPFIQGWDGEGHAAVGQYYSDHIFPSSWGWIPNWYTGMPFPQFYPPLFYMFLAGLYHVLPFSYITLFKVVVTLLELLVPATLVYFVSFRTKNPASRIVAGVFSVLFVSAVFPEIGNSGMTVAATLYTGMVTQLFGFIMFMCWLHFFLQIEKSRRAQILAGFFLLCTFISNVHNILVTFILFVVTYLVSLVTLCKEKFPSRTAFLKASVGHFFLYFLSGAIPLVATAFWTLPVYMNYSYFVTASPWSPPNIIGFIMIFPVVFILAMVGLFIFKYFKDRTSLILSVTIGVVFFVVYNNSWLEQHGLPAHVNRWFGVLCFFVPILIAFMYDHVSRIIKSGAQRLALYGFMCILFLSSLYSFLSADTPDGYYTGYTDDHVADILKYVRSNSDIGMMMTEVSRDGDPSLMVIDSLVGLNNSGGDLTNIFRESSINSVFLTPVRNALSSGIEGWGFRTYLAFDEAFLKQDKSLGLDRAERIGIQSFLVRSRRTKDAFMKDDRVFLKKDFGGWALFSFKNKMTRSEVLRYAPVHFYGNLNFKERAINDYDWARFQEGILYSDSKNTTFTYPHDQYIDSSSDFFTASTTVVSTYAYHDLKIAYARMLSYSKKNNLVLVADENPLFQMMYHSMLATSTRMSQHVQILDHVSPSLLDNDPTQTQMTALFKSIEGSSTPVASVPHTNAVISANKIEVRLDATSTVPLPVLVKVSYFPAWQRTDGVPIYLASPGFMLTYATSSFTLIFTTPWYVRAGNIISLAAILCGLSIAVFYKYRRKYSSV